MPDEESLWPNFIDQEVGIQPPLNLLREQAEMLSSATGGKLQGEVRRVLDSTTDMVYCKFYVVASELDFRTRIVSVSYSISEPYPVSVDSRGDGPNATEVGNPEELKAHLRSVFSSPAIVKMIQSLIQHLEAS